MDRQVNWPRVTIRESIYNGHDSIISFKFRAHALMPCTFSKSRLGLVWSDTIYVGITPSNLLPTPGKH